MSLITVIPQRSETLVSGQREISESTATRHTIRVRLVANDISTRWSSGKLDDLLTKLLSALSVIYLMGAAGFVGILLFRAFSP